MTADRPAVPPATSIVPLPLKAVNSSSPFAAVRTSVPLTVKLCGPVTGKLGAGPAGAGAGAAEVAARGPGSPTGACGRDRLT